MAQSRWENLGLWIAMCLAQLPILGLFLSGQFEGAAALALLFVLPIPALVLSFFAYRPSRSVPEHLPIRDWGTALGWSFVQAGHRTYWVTASSLDQLADADDLAPLLLETDVDGFELRIPVRSAGRPDSVFAALRSAVATALVWSIALLVDTLLNAPAGGSLGAWLGVSLLSVPAVLALQLPAMVPLMLVYEWYGRRQVGMKLRGRKLTVDGETFLLGQPGERIDHGPPGTLTLSNASQALVVNGRASTLAQLVPVLRGVTADTGGSGQASEVPDALAALAARTIEG